MNINGSRLRKANPVSISGILVSILGDINNESDFFIGQLKKEWKLVVGETNARNMKPVSLDKGILTAAVSSPGWLTELQFARKKLLEKINGFESIHRIHVKDIRFILDTSS
ncbi:DciA family protein [Candidatus Latescibacterota bacterium]